MAAELRMAFADVPALEREIGANLKHGRAFSNELAGVQVLSDCTLVLVHPAHGGELRLAAYVVMVCADGPVKGTGLEMRPWNAALLAQVEEFARSTAPLPSAAARESAEIDAEFARVTQTGMAAVTVPIVPAVPPAPVAPPAPSAPPADASGSANADDVPAHGPADDPSEPAAEEGEGHEAEDDQGYDHHELEADDSDEPLNEDGKPIELQQVERHQDKLRHLSITEQLKVARTGELADRIAVERLYGKQVWESLLHNPRLSIPEVARIARKGTVPKPLIDVILDNKAWNKTPQVRRALFTNPKCSAEAVAKLLRNTPKHELKQISKSTAYTQQVRDLAQKLLKQEK